MQEILINIALYLTYGMIGIATLSAIAFPIIHLVDDPKKAKNSVIGIVGLVVLFLVCYFISSNEVTEKMGTISPALSKLVGGSLLLLYIMLFLTVGIALYAAVAKFFK